MSRLLLSAKRLLEARRPDQMFQNLDLNLNLDLTYSEILTGHDIMR